MIKLWPDREIRVRKTRIGRVPILILRPERRPPVPIGVLWIHGGGYILGMKEMVYMSRAMDLVKSFGVTVISPGYRLAWKKPFPAAACHAAPAGSSFISLMKRMKIWRSWWTTKNGKR